jgi:2-polyprenyl-3-methyl-5-hydroxy-6-metoxy-1,4-benzoquinol methylase
MICKICGGKNLFRQYTIDYFTPSFDILKCLDCGFSQQPVSKADAYKFYDEDYYAGKSEYSYIDERQLEEASRIVWKARLKRIARWDKAGEPKRYLDVGCSFGGLIQVASEAGYAPYGVEVSDYSGAYARNRFGKDNVIVGNIEEINLTPDYFNVVSLIEIAEHLYDPRKAFENIYKAIKPGGFVFIQTANMDGLQAKFWKEKYHYYVPGHLSYFTRKTLKRLLLDTGFTRVKFIPGVEFGLLPKLRKSRASFKRPRDYFKWFRIAFYHWLSKIAVGNFQGTSSMVMIGWK